MYNPNEDKRENENNMEPIHGHVENEHEEKVLSENDYSENTSNVYESKDVEQNAAEDAKVEEVKSEQSQQTYHSETLRDYTPEDAQPMCFESETAEKADSIRNLWEKKEQKNLFMQLVPEKNAENRKKTKIAMQNM